MLEKYVYTYDTVLTLKEFNAEALNIISVKMLLIITWVKDFSRIYFTNDFYLLG